MIEEQYITFETAKLAKEKGFTDCCTHKIYESNGELHNAWAYPGADEYFAYTQSVLNRWLREKHSIHVFAYKAYSSYEYRLQYFGEQIGYGNPPKPTYEEAMEEGLKEALNVIK